MKTLFLTSCLLIASISFGQHQRAERKVCFKPEKAVEVKVAPTTLEEKIQDVIGDFEIEKYSILSTKTPNKRDLNLLVGTLVRIQDTNITGDEIDPMSFMMYEIEHMSSNDYIFRVFGRQIRAPEPDLPSRVKVHKTDNENCYGIIDLGLGKVAVPYKGVLLFLKRK